MRKLAAAGFALAAGTACAHWLLPYKWLYLAAALLALPLALGAVFLRGTARTRCVIICAAAALGICWYSLYTGTYFGAAAEYAGTTGTVTVRVDEYPYTDGEYGSVEVTLAEPGVPRLKISVADYNGALPTLRPGDTAELTLDFVDATTRYGESTDSYAARGVHLRAYFVSCGEVSRDWKSALYFPQELMNTLSRSIRSVFPEDVRDIMLALLIGETHGVYDDYELDNALSVTGVAHVISVSGIHLSFLWAAMTMLFGKRRAMIPGAVLIVVFTLMTGCAPATVRACVMLLFTMLGTALKREADGLTSLAFALIVLLAANPVSIASLSLQLSFASMLGLICISPHVNAYLTRRFNRKGMKARGLRAAVITNAASSAGATVFTLPLVALDFGYVSLVSPVANVLTMWAVSLAFTVGFAAACIGAVIPVLGTALAWAAAVPARFFVAAVELLAKFPYAAVYTADNYVVWWIAASYAFFIAAYFLRPRPGKPGSVEFQLRKDVFAMGRKRHGWAFIPAACSAALLLAVIVSAPMRTAGEKSVTVLDVGQGQSIALLSGKSSAVVDCGGGGTWDDAGDTASEYLLSRGRRSLDALVLTHLHSDHANGAARLLTRLDVDTLYIPAGTDDSDGELADILEAAAGNGTEVVEIGSEDMAVELDGMTLNLLAPVGAGDENERGLVIAASIGGYDALITGDAGASVERKLISNGSLGEAELLVAGHHGSKNSNSFELVSTVMPETVVVSVGYNSYGHPTDEALERLAMTGAKIYRTDVNGSVTVRIDENG